MKTAAKYLLLGLTFFTACTTPPDPNILLKENIRTTLVRNTTENLQKNTSDLKLDTLILVKVDTLTEKKATQYLKDAIQKDYALYDKLYKATENLIVAQKDMQKWISKDMRKGTVVDETDNVQKNKELKQKLDRWQATMDSCDKVIASPAADTSKVGYYAHYIIKLSKTGKPTETDTIAEQLSKDLKVEKLVY